MIGVEFCAKTFDINNKKVKIQIWDTAGQEAFQAITRTYYKGAIGAILVYDISRRETFTHVKKWLEEVRNYCCKNVVIILVGNKKNDLEDKRRVSYKEGEDFAKENGLIFLETSTKNSNDIDEALQLSIQCILKNIERGEIILDSSSNINLNKGMIKQDKGVCCF